MYSGEIAAGNRVFWGGIHAYSNADANYNMMRSTLMWYVCLKGGGCDDGGGGEVVIVV